MDHNKIFIENINDSQRKSEVVKEILSDLTKWFGLPESTQAYIEESKVLTLFAARNGDEVIGFITLNETSEDVCEIHCMGLKKEYHRKGMVQNCTTLLKTLLKKSMSIFKSKPLMRVIIKNMMKPYPFIKV